MVFRATIDIVGQGEGWKNRWCYITFGQLIARRTELRLQVYMRHNDAESHGIYSILCIVFYIPF